YAGAAAQADRLVSMRLVNQRLIPSAMEPRAIRASFDAADEQLTIYLPSQVPHMSRRWLAETLRWPENRIHLVAPDLGGGFGAKVRLVTTNTTPVDAYRGAGRTEAAYIIERTMDAVADELGTDPLELRRLNLIRADQFPYTPYGHPMVRWDSGNYEGCLEEAARAIAYTEWREKQAALRAQGRYIG